MNQKSSFKIVVLTSFVLLALLLLSLPYPFNCLFSWTSDCCSCSCPWFIFVLLQFLLSFFWYRYLNQKGEKDKLARAIVFVSIGLLVFLIQIFSVKYYLSKEAYESIGLCARFWMFDLVLTIIFILI